MLIRLMTRFPRLFLLPLTGQVKLVKIEKNNKQKCGEY